MKIRIMKSLIVYKKMIQVDSGMDNMDSVEGYDLMDETLIVTSKTKGRRHMKNNWHQKQQSHQRKLWEEQKKQQMEQGKRR